MEKTRAFNDKYQISKTAHKLAADTSAKVSDLNEQHQVTEKAKASTAAMIEKGKEMDEKYCVSQNAKQTAESTASKLGEFNQKHQLTEHMNRGFATGKDTFLRLASKVTASSKASSGGA